MESFTFFSWKYTPKWSFSIATFVFRSVNMFPMELVIELLWNTKNISSQKNTWTTHGFPWAFYRTQPLQKDLRWWDNIQNIPQMLFFHGDKSHGIESVKYHLEKNKNNELQAVFWAFVNFYFPNYSSSSPKVEFQPISNRSGQISIIPKPELRGFWGSSLIKPPFRV